MKAVRLGLVVRVSDPSIQEAELSKASLELRRAEAIAETCLKTIAKETATHKLKCLSSQEGSDLGPIMA